MGQNSRVFTPEEFLLSCAPNLKEALKGFSGSKKECIDLILNSAVLFSVYFSKGIDLRANAEVFPERKKEIIEKVLSTPAVFQACFKDTYELTRNAKAFPEYKAEMLEKVLSTPAVFQDCFSKGEGLRNAKAFPEQKKEIIEKVLRTPAVFQACFVDGYELTLNAEAFPEQKKEIIEKVLSTSAVFQACFSSGVDLRDNAGAFPEYKAEMLEKVLSTSAVFQACFEDNYDRTRNAEAFPEFANRMNCLYALRNTSLEELIKKVISTKDIKFLNEFNFILQEQRNKYLIDKANINLLKRLKGIIAEQLPTVEQHDLQQKLIAILNSIANLLTPVSTLKHLALTFFAKEEHKKILDNLIAAKNLTVPEDCISDILEAKENPVSLSGFFK